ncbi:MAG TPA: hydrogenase expression/formation C-terminal domain-containing protein [Xanthomonadales bacterium]|nr:hydrogenase expression/formation C-terminal domain-containing protein [Xanthomonadales bacterium]
MKRDTSAPCMTTRTTGMAYSILSEIAQRLQLLAERNETSAIDLRSLPMTQADRDQLEAMLGRGEVSARLEIAGPSEVWETAYAGVWWIRHMGAGGRIATEEIAVTRSPEILLTHPQDVTAAALRIRTEFNRGTTDEPALEASHV